MLPAPLAPRPDRLLFERLFANDLAFLARPRDAVEREDGMDVVTEVRQATEITESRRGRAPR
jgi:hypothetical protein